jgi:hypothetical protein
MKYRLYNIVWDLTYDSGEDNPEVYTPEGLGLPTSVVIECDGDISLEGADLLSDKFGWCVHSFEFEAVAYYISFEQEAILSDCFPSLSNNRLDYGYVVISDCAWDAEGPDWKPILIGPIKETELSKDVMSQIATLLRANGALVAVCGEGDLRDARGYERSGMRHITLIWMMPYVNWKSTDRLRKRH